MSNYKIKYFIWILILVFSCEIKREIETNNYENDNKNPLQFISSLSTLKIINGEKEKLNLILYSQKPKLLIYVNGNCSLCIDDLRNWEEYITKNNLLTKANVLFIAESNEPHILDYFVNEKINFSFPLAIDTTKSRLFFKENNYFKNIKEVLVNYKNEIIYEGDPRRSVEAESELLKRISLD